MCSFLTFFDKIENIFHNRKWRHTETPCVAKYYNQERRKRMFVLGNQDPFDWGILGAHALREIGGSVEDRAVIYYQQDADRPWRSDGLVGPPRIRHGFPDYCSLTRQMMYSPTFRKNGIDSDLNCVQQSLRLQVGRVYFQGSARQQTLWHFMRTEDYPQAENKFFEVEFKHYEGLHQIGVPMTDLFHDLLALRDQFSPTHAAEEYRRVACEQYGFSECPPISLVEMFREQPPSLLRELPSESFWQIDGDGMRKQWCGYTVHKNKVYVPKRDALILELALKGSTIVHRSLPYLERVRFFRDRHCQSLRIKTMRIQLTCCGKHISGALAYAFNSKRRKSGKPLLSHKAVEKINNYWENRPTVMGSLLLANLNVSATIETVQEW